MFALILKKISLTFRIYKLILLGIYKILTNKSTFNNLLAEIEMNKLENRLCFWKTIYFNFRTMPVKYAWKTPVWIYGDIRFFDLSGKVIPLDISDIYPKSVVIGHMDQGRSVGDVSSITLSGVFYFGHGIVIRQGAKWKIRGELSIKDNCYIGDNVTFFIDKRCEIGKASFIANNSTLMDTDIHYIIDINTMAIKDNCKPIEIGEGCWLGSFTTVKRGTKIPDYTIVAGPYSAVGKDYTTELEPYSCIGGNPAKFIKNGLRQIANGRWELFLNDYYRKNEDVFFWNGNINDICDR